VLLLLTTVVVVVVVVVLLLLLGGTGATRYKGSGVKRSTGTGTMVGTSVLEEVVDHIVAADAWVGMTTLPQMDAQGEYADSALANVSDRCSFR
jgi:hypothetical protein